MSLALAPSRPTEPYNPKTAREYGKRFIRYHIDPSHPNAPDFFDEHNRKAARSIWGDLSEYVLGPIYVRVMFYIHYYLALWDDIMFTWDWGRFKSHDEDFSSSGSLAIRYTHGWDRPNREAFEWKDRPQQFHHY